MRAGLLGGTMAADKCEQNWRHNKLDKQQQQPPPRRPGGRAGTDWQAG